MIYEINDTPVIMPSACIWGLNYISGEDSGRTLSGEMYIDAITTKRKLEASWNGITQIQTTVILQLVNQKRFMKVKYDDLLSGTTQTRTFYIGDPTAQAYIWNAGHKKLSSLAFNFIEK